jgi:bacterioferritin-associated ferredoxin
MYLCLCNGISDAQVEQAMREGARRPRDVYARCGSRAQCGRCTAAILGALRGLSAAASAPHANQNR